MSTTAVTLLGPVDKLAVLTEVERRIAAIKTVDKAKGVRDQAEALRVYAKSRQLGLEVQNHAAFIKIQAERRAGELLAQMEKAKNQHSPADSTLESAGITRQASHRWQLEAKVPEAAVRKLYKRADAWGYELTSAAVHSGTLIGTADAAPDPWGTASCCHVSRLRPAARRRRRPASHRAPRYESRATRGV